MHSMANIYNCNMIEQEEQKSWKLAVKINYHGEHLFKTKPISADQFIMHLPRQKTVQTFDMSLNQQDPTYQFDNEMNAIEQIELKNGTYVAAGSKDGLIQLQNTNRTQKYFLTLDTPIERDRRYINDFVVCQNSRLVNCYNNGAVAVWNLNQQLSNDIKPTSYNIIHDSFFYKMRKIDDNTVLTASNDFTAKIFDLQAATVIDSFEHVDAVWCAYPLNQRVFCTSGLMNSIIFWDSRSHRIINRCHLRNEQTSFVTRYDENSIIFGDGNQIAVCDLRRPVKVAFTQHRMQVSAETILVGDKGVIVAGRGGDICLLKKGGSQIQAEQRNVGNSTLSPMMRFFQMMRFNMNNRFGLVNNEEVQDIQDDQDVEDFEDQQLDALQEQFMRDQEQLESDQELEIVNQSSEHEQSNDLFVSQNSPEHQVSSNEVAIERDVSDEMEIQVEDKQQQQQMVQQHQVQKQQSNSNKQQQELPLGQQNNKQQDQNNKEQKPQADKK